MGLWGGRPPLPATATATSPTGAPAATAAPFIKGAVPSMSNNYKQYHTALNRNGRGVGWYMAAARRQCTRAGKRRRRSSGQGGSWQAGQVMAVLSERMV